MGRTYLFDCPKCGYKARVAGGAEDGRDFSLQTIHCRECRKLYDCVIRLRTATDAAPRPVFGVQTFRTRKGRKMPGPPPRFDEVLQQMPAPAARQSGWAEYRLCCPVSPVHRVEAWNNPGKCPLCGIYLEKGPLAFRVWE